MTAGEKKLHVVRAIVYVIAFAFFTYLFYLECTGVLVSDMPNHVKRALTNSAHDYTILSPLIIFFHSIGGMVGVSVMFSLIEVATIYVSERLMRKLAPNASIAVIFVCAVCCNVAIAVYCPLIHPYLTRGLSVGNQWHNSTFLGMRLVGLAVIWFYLRFVGYFESKSHVLDGIGFTVSVILSAAVKPSLILSMGPALAVICVYDLVKYGKGTLRRSLVMAAAFVLAIALIVPLQASALYGAGSRSGLGIGFFSVWRHFNSCIPLGMLQSWAFPLIVLCYCGSIRFKDRNYQLTWMVFLVSLFVYAFLKETGYRKYHGNFAWGLNFADYYLMITAICAYLKTRYDKAAALFGKNKPNTATEIVNAGVSLEPTHGPAFFIRFANSKAFDICAITLFALHTISGFISFGSILMGNGYA